MQHFSVNRPCFVLTFVHNLSQISLTMLPMDTSQQQRKLTYLILPTEQNRNREGITLQTLPTGPKQKNSTEFVLSASFKCQELFSLLPSTLLKRGCALVCELYTFNVIFRGNKSSAYLTFWACAIFEINTYLLSVRVDKIKLTPQPDLGHVTLQNRIL